MSKSIHDILAELRDASMDERDKGDLFERLTKRWLEVDPSYSDFFEKVWLFPDWAEEVGKPKNDTGIDLVARERETGDYWAIQCKFYAENARLDKPEIDSFFTASGKNDFNGRIIFSTTDNWTTNAEAALENQRIPVTRIRVQDLDDSAVDWSSFSLKKDSQLLLQDKKTPRPHQVVAIEAAKDHFAKADRGKLIMACGTGKTYTSLQIAEEMVPDGGTMLFLVPSIALLSQTLKEWKRESKRKITAYAVCSDSKIGKRKEDEDIQVPDLAYPATTNTDRLAWHFKHNKERKEGFTVIFSTYQSIEVVAEAQGAGVPDFDLIVCDEAHRTTGVTLAGSDESAFVRVHDNNFISGKKRLYMTATPRIYAEQSKSKAKEADATLASMDDENLYGEEFHRLNFGQAVSAGLLSDYKVLVLAVSEDHVSRQLQKLLTKDGELDLDDATKIVGCYNGLRKRSSNNEDFLVDAQPMKTAVAFARSIKDSKKLAELFGVVTRELNLSEGEKKPLVAEVEHVDGTFNVLARNSKLDWLKDKKTENTVRILSNARCLSEGVDVPALDAVLFLNPRDSQVDVVQSVGRVMRKAEGKEYGYVILPITVPVGKTAEEALADNNRYKVVWQVLQALRSHDERFNAMVNKIELNGDTDGRLKIIGVGGESDESRDSSGESRDTAQMFDFFLDDWKEAILAKIVQKVGERTYWENWAKDVATIADDHVARINHLLSKSDAKLRSEFDLFLEGLKDNLNPHVTEAEAVEMLAQHLITKPVFDALFSNYAFSEKNPVSLVMQRILDALDEANINLDAEGLERFYESVRIRAEGIDDLAGRQKIIKDLYEKFFKIAFSNSAERLGIVYTPNDLVDFIIRLTNSGLKKYFNTEFTDEGVNILDPFTGTGTFIVRLIQSGLISSKDLERKFRYELHANELVLLAYYVAAINIEESYHSLTGKDYEPFDGIVLTDTFQMYENDDKDEIAGMEVFVENNQRVLKQKKNKITVVIGNPPYSAGQNSANDNNANLKYPTLDARVNETFGALSSAQNKNTLYDSYIRAIRWAIDRVDNDGIVCFVTNNGFIDSGTSEGLRKSLVAEASDLYVINLRGNSLTAGDVAKREGGNVFDIRVGVSVFLLVKKSASQTKSTLNYFEFPDYSSREDKLSTLRGWDGLESIDWTSVTPNTSGDWINQRSEAFSKYIPLAGRDGDSRSPSFFNTHSAGLKTNRDSWVYNFSESLLEENIKTMIANYGQELRKNVGKPVAELNKVLNMDPKFMSWNEGTKRDISKGVEYKFDESLIRRGSYRPFCEQFVYLDKRFMDRAYQLPSLFPTKESSNFGIYITAPGSGHDFCAFAVGNIPDTAFWGSGGGQFFPRYSFEDASAFEGSLFDALPMAEQSGKSDNVSQAIVEEFSGKLGFKVTSDEMFSYVYAVLNSASYISANKADLKKVLPRLPIHSEFKRLSNLGQELLGLHLDFENAAPYKLEVQGEGDFRFEKLKVKAVDDETFKVVVNSKITVLGVPKEALDFKVGSRAPLEWLEDKVQLKVDKKSALVSDPNDWFAKRGGLDYLVKVLGSLTTVGLESKRIRAEIDQAWSSGREI